MNDNTINRTIRRMLVLTAGTVACIGTIAGAANAETPPAPANNGSMVIVSPTPPPPPPKPKPSHTPSYAITDLSMTGHGTWAHLRWRTNAPTTQLSIGRAKPTKVNGTWRFPDDTSVFGLTINGTGIRAYDAWNLTPGTQYWYILRAPSVFGSAPVEVSGSFTTLERKVSVTFYKFHITSDADKGIRGDGEMMFWFDVDGIGGHRPYYSFEAGSGSDRQINYLGKGYLEMGWFQDGPATVDFAVQGFEDDGVGFCPPHLPQTGYKQGDGECGDYAFAQGSVTLPKGALENATIPFAISVTHTPALQFTVYGWVEVSYV